MRSGNRAAWWLAMAGAALVVGGALAARASREGWWSGSRVELPYDRTNPVVYDNDDVADVYADEYLLSLASLGDVRLNGIITSTSVAPYNVYATPHDYERIISQRDELLAAAKSSGLTNVPAHVRGPMAHLEKPRSAQIDDTTPIGAPGSHLIVAEARKATPEKPLVVVVGGPATAEADAYLLDHAIADRVIVAWLAGQRQDLCEYNVWADGWAGYIVMEKLRVVMFPNRVGMPDVPKARLLQLPPSAMRDYMYKKHHPTNGDPGHVDADAPPAISLVRPEFPTMAKRIAFKGWDACSMTPPDGPAGAAHDVPAFAVSENGSTLLVENSRAPVATNEWWRALTAALSARRPN